MSTAAHTPGPWHYQEGSDAYTHIVRTGEISRDHPYAGRRFLCQLAQDTSGEAEANARLIAAAPDLLAALKLCEPFCKGHQETPEKVARYQQVLTAIARAEGRS